MRWITIMMAAAAVTAAGAEYTVCNTAGECNFSDLQAALDAAQQGDILTLRAGETFSRPGGFILRPKQGDGWLRIRSSRMNELTEGNRVGPEQSAAGLLSRIMTRDSETALQFAPAARFAAVDPLTNTLTSNGHGYANGTPVNAQGNLGSPYVCTGVATPYPAADCPADRVGKFNIRGRTALSTGAVVYLFGPTLPEPFAQDTPYYVVDSTETASFSSFRLAASPDGEPITPTTAGSGFSYEAPPAPLRNGESLFVVNATANTFQLARSAGGEPIDLTTTGAVHWNSAYVAGVAVQEATAVKNVIIEGVEITVQPRVFTWILAMLGSGSYSRAAVPNHIVIDRSYIHGQPGDLGPHQCVYVNAADVAIVNSTITECKSNSADAQAILVMSSPGGIQIENNRLEASGESIMFGGGYPSYRGLIPEGAIIRRNYFTKPLSWRAGMSTYVADTQTVRIRQWGRAEPCPVAATRPEGGQCFVYDRQGVRHAYMNDLNITAPAGSGTVFFMYDNGLKAVHNLQALTCSEEIECVQSASLAWPESATRLSILRVSNNVFTGVETQLPVVKNAFEVKNGKNIVLEGNILEHAWAAAQNTLIVLNVGTANNAREAINYWAAASDIVARNNIIRKAASAVGGSGRSYLGGRPEVDGFGFGGRIVFRNNLFQDIDSVRWSHLPSGAAATVGVTRETDVLLDHNTFAGVENIVRLNGNPGPNANDYISLTNNIVVPRPGLAFPAFVGDGIASFQHAKTMNHNVNGTMTRNVLLNTTGTTSWIRANNVDYPPDTWLINGANTPDAIGFIDWGIGDYRLLSGSRFSARCRGGCIDVGTTGRDLGADFDEIYALTRGVEEGLPEWAVRARVKTEPSGTTATLSWDALRGESCEVRVYADSTYANVIEDVDPSVDATRSREARTTLADGMRQFVIGRFSPLTPQTKYQYKLICGNDIAVGSFETLALSATVDVTHQPPAGTVTVATKHGPAPESLSEAAEFPCGVPDGCTVTVPHGDYFEWTYRDAAGRSSKSAVHAAR